MFKIALDAGHGLNTAGKQTPTGIKEWTLNDGVRDKVIAILSGYDCEIINTDNNEGAVDDALSARLKRYLDGGADVFVSIHHNAFAGDWNNATGVEVYTDTKFTAEDNRLAQLIYNKLTGYTGLKGRGIKRSDFYVINQNKIPAVLCEGGFMDSEKDYKVITSEKGQTAYAKAVAEGLIEFLGLEKKSTEAKPTKKKTVNEIAVEVTKGLWGNGEDRKKRLAAAGYNYAEIQAKVNSLLSAKPKSTKKSVDEIAKEVIAGKWGVGQARKLKLTAAGYNYYEVQKKVNKLMK